MRVGEGREGGKACFSSFLALRSVSRVLPVAREQRRGEERRGEERGRARWMDGSLPADALRFGPLPLPARPGRPASLTARLGTARPGWTRGKNVLPRNTNSRRTTNERTDGRTRTNAQLCVRLGLSRPSARRHVCLNSECGPSLISSPFSSPSRLYFAIISQPSEAST